VVQHRGSDVGTVRLFASVTASNVQDKVQMPQLCKYRLRYTEKVFVGGFDPNTGVFNTEINAQIDQAFENVQLALTDAGGKGWSQVFRVTTYHVPINDEAMGAVIRNFKKWMPDHQPIWTCLGVTRLAKDDMRVEIEVVAHDPHV
jgi:enamine deaminase RidA (YjgF/YER057c/UK114 family)